MHSSLKPRPHFKPTFLKVGISYELPLNASTYKRTEILMSNIIEYQILLKRKQWNLTFFCNTYKLKIEGHLSLATGDSRMSYCRFAPDRIQPKVDTRLNYYQTLVLYSSLLQ